MVTPDPSQCSCLFLTEVVITRLPGAKAGPSLLPSSSPLPSPLLTWLYSSRTVSADDPRWETRALTLPSPEELKCRFDFFAVRPRLVSPPVLPVLSESRPLLDASFHEIIDNGQSTAARGGAEESGDRCPHLQPCHKTSLPNYSIKTRV